MARPFTRRQALQNRAFLDLLAKTGNARLAAREIGVAHSTMHDRRKKHADFAQHWDAAVVAAHARFHLAGGRRGPEAKGRPGFEGVEREKKKVLRQAQDERETKRKMEHLPSSSTPGLHRNDGRRLRTEGGEPVVVRTRNGKLQLRPAHKGKLTKACEQAFLFALSATANVRMSAAAAGASARAFYRRRQESPAFAREMRLALREGYDRLEAAAFRAGLAESYEDDEWRQHETPPIPPMTANQALQLLCLHQKGVRLGGEKPHRRRRRGESDATLKARLVAMWQSEKAREADELAVRRAILYEETGSWRFEDEGPPPRLPPLELVTGWSRADPSKVPHDPKLALFGGWRIKEMEAKRRKG